MILVGNLPVLTANDSSDRNYFLTQNYICSENFRLLVQFKKNDLNPALPLDLKNFFCLILMPFEEPIEKKRKVENGKDFENDTAKLSLDEKKSKRKNEVFTHTNTWE